MTKTEQAKAQKWMRRDVHQYVDYWGEVKMTELAQDCAIELFNRAAEEEEFEEAFDAAEWYERTPPNKGIS